MLDIGWSELLVIAVVLIVVVGPKDLPPMIRAFGKTMAGLRKMAGDFRTQFDEALKEADMDDVRQTISDVRNLNPTNSLRDAMNPLRQLGNDIKSDLQKAATPAATSAPATSEPVAPLVSVPEPDMKLPDTPPVVPVEAVGPATSAPAVVTASEAGETKPKRSRAKKTPAADAVATADVPAPAAPVAAKPKRVAAKKAPASAETVAAAPKTAAVKKPAAPKDGVKAAAARTAKPKAAKAKKDEA